MKLPEGITKFDELAYITTLKRENEPGEKTGTVLLYRKKGEEEFLYALTCPYCRTEQKSRVVFKRRPYRIKCSNCGKSIVIEKLSK
jgi:ribosomal protein S27E